MKKKLLALACFLSACFSSAFGGNSCVAESTSLVKAVAVSGLQFQEQNGHVPYSFYYPYEYGYYYPETYGGYTGTSQGHEDCYSHLENGTFFYQCD
ncbi:hypothetical protein ABCH17_01325 [Chlamydia abortus]|uniref:hypothetical protein n=1 Tax=Chlamydia abortus TaxID=83555 RepID=UPI00165930B1|nr:hypothetical protein [Chlamydia abortus]CAG9045931.1 hypothetical protein NVRI1_00266 [Chlamydia abortus]